MGPNGFSVEVINYDAVGRPIRFCPERPEKQGEALAVFIAYDALGNAIRIEYRDHGNELTNGASGFAKGTIAYDPLGKVEAITYTNSDAMPVNILG